LTLNHNEITIRLGLRVILGGGDLDNARFDATLVDDSQETLLLIKLTSRARRLSYRIDTECDEEITVESPGISPRVGSDPITLSLRCLTPTHKSHEFVDGPRFGTFEHAC